jgi:uncharacterized protein YacL (UPF0231 family)
MTDGNGLRFDLRVTLGNVLTIVAMVATLVGAWFSLKTEVMSDTITINQIRESNDRSEDTRKRIIQSLQDVNTELGKIEQALADHGIVVKDPPPDSPKH